VLCHDIEIGLCGIESRTDCLELNCDAALFGLEQVKGDRTGIVRIEQFLPLAREPLLLQLQLTVDRLCRGRRCGQLGRKRVLDVVSEVRAQLHVPVDLLDAFLHDGDQDGLERAGGPLLVPASAHEVRVHHTVPVLGVRDDQPGSALAAIDARLQVVVVNNRLLPGTLPSKDPLHFSPCLLVDEDRVSPLVLDSAPNDRSLVVGMLQN